MVVSPLSVVNLATVRVFLLLLVLPVTVRAADQTLLGRQFVLKNPSTPEKRKITLKAKEFGTDNSIVGDPVANGATLTVTATGGTPTSQTYDLPAGTSTATGKPLWVGDPIKGFEYEDPKGEHGAVKTAQIKRQGAVFRVKIAISGELGAVTVVPPNPGTTGCVLLAIAGGDSYSVSFAGGRVTDGGATLFKIVKPLSQGSCVTTTTSTTTTSSSTTLPVPCGSAMFPTCGGMCPDGYACEGVDVSANSDIPTVCGGSGTLCGTPPTQECTCVAASDACSGSCASYCPMSFSFTPGDCGSGRHCALRIDYFCFVAGGSCFAGCVDD